MPQLTASALNWLASWPYLSGGWDLESMACTYVQMGMDIYTQLLANVADFSLEIEIYPKESRQNQLWIQRIISLLTYCTINPRAVSELCDRAIVLGTEDMFKFTQAFTQAKQDMKESIWIFATYEGAVPKPGPWSQGNLCECPLDTLLEEVNGLDRDWYTFAVTPPSLGFQVRNVISKLASNLE